MICDCAETPSKVTGPSGSDALCLGALLFDGVLWLAALLPLLRLQQKESSYRGFDKILRSGFYAIALLALALLCPLKR